MRVDQRDHQAEGLGQVGAGRASPRPGACRPRPSPGRAGRRCRRRSARPWRSRRRRAAPSRRSRSRRAAARRPRAPSRRAAIPPPRRVGEVPLALVGDLVAAPREAGARGSGCRARSSGSPPDFGPSLEQAAAELRSARRRGALGPRRMPGERRRAPPARCEGPAAGRPGCGSGSRRAGPGSGRSAGSRGSASTSTCCRRRCGS